MDTSPEGSGKAKQDPGDKGFRMPGLRGARTTALFRAVNPELFIKPSFPVMVFGVLSLSVCVLYLSFLHLNKEEQLYEAVSSDGERYMRKRTSKWD